MDAMIRSKGVAADCLRAIRKKLVPADYLKRSVAKSLLLIIKHVSSKKDAADFTHVVNVNGSCHESHLIIQHLILYPDDLCIAT
ncbi:hypothetical protein L1987_57776 [Smallanthus sonchifolius]|uniref:Uncharacterized protein n=1 Tax=Smallanthus sonchifolius TaxID=185202 RepID=A0ACB9DEG7_9ASTR|nr:hypothetical protein L1987_57776 [Smallanthus sonchifolius]